MAKCPHCEASLDFLVAVVDERNTYSFDEEGNFYEHREQIDHDVDYFKCPHCNEKLADLDNDTDKAQMFLINSED